MKKFIIYSIAGLLAVFALAGCSDWLKPERKVVQHPEEQSPILRDDAYYAALREYKKTEHKLAFGWYGSWTATGASYQSRLVSAPDSMDIISIWSQWHSLTPEQMADKEYVQKVKGTKVTFTTFLDNIPEEFRAGEVPTEEEIATFAAAWGRDSIAKYNYDGMDIDYEPGYGASGPLVGNPCPELFNVLIRELGKYLGPKSGTGKLLIIDGVPYAVRGEMAEYFDYGIVQAYASGGYTDLQNRFNSAYNNGWKPEQYIFAENFESYWQDGGVTHTTREGETVNSLLGMARFNPTQGFCAGFGAYHMEYEYAHHDMPYKFMRKAIQDINPVGGSLVTTMSSTSSVSSLVENGASFDGEFSADFTLRFAHPLPADVSFDIVLDNSLVETYNNENGTDYYPVDASNLTISPITAKAGSIVSNASSISFDPSGLSGGIYIIPLRVELPEGGAYQAQTGSELVFYAFVSLINEADKMLIDTEATALTGAKIAPAKWTISCYQGKNDSGATGVWNLDSDDQKAYMFDGVRDDKCWYASSQSFSWANGGNFVIELGRKYEIDGFRWSIYYQDSNPECIDFQYSQDGKVWVSVMNGETFVPKTTENWKIFQLKKPIKARYIRVFVGSVTSYTSMNEAEIYAPSN